MSCGRGLGVAQTTKAKGSGRVDLIRLAQRAEASYDAIAAALGFGGASAFYRAFKRWTGSTPGAVRAAKRASQLG